MKLLLVCILFLIFLVLKSGLAQDLKEDVSVAESKSEQQEMLALEYASLRTKGGHPFCLCQIKMDVSVKGDIFDDHSVHCPSFVGKIFKHNRTMQAGQVKAFYSQKFMRLLSARHSNGFYIYFLEKLII